jgi:hypothetical protein
MSVGIAGLKLSQAGGDKADLDEVSIIKYPAKQGATMIDSKVWAVDRVAAANLGRALGLNLDDEQLNIAAGVLAEHRTSAFDMAVSRIRSSILERIHEVMLNAQEWRSADWSEGCRSAEHAILTITSDELLEVGPIRERSKGQILRTMLGQARKKMADDVKHQGLKRTQKDG